MAVSKRTFHFSFPVLSEPKPGCGYQFYWNWSIRTYGRGLFKEAVQAAKDDLGYDVWEAPEDFFDGGKP